tara:strand:+ start:1640 stop:2308 length:669 start_codon:yes stop_codon:yes gene_type:complete
MISHHHKTLFVHVPKCGGQSIETLFIEDLGLDWDTRAPLLLRANSNHRLGPPRLAHLLVSEYTRFKYMTEEQFRFYYKFAFVRNPYTRIVSLFNYLPLKIDFSTFVEKWLPKQFSLAHTYRTYPHSYLGYYHFVRPQVDFISNEEGDFLTENIFKLEEIDKSDSMGIIRQRCGLKGELKHINMAKEIKATISNLKGSHIKIIDQLYYKDFSLLNYPKMHIQK